jgi:hypothetical protein
VKAVVCIWVFTSIIGMMLEATQMSTKDRLEVKNYMGVCR